MTWHDIDLLMTLWLGYLTKPDHHQRSPACPPTHSVECGIQVHDKAWPKLEELLCAIQLLLVMSDLTWVNASAREWFLLKNTWSESLGRGD